MDTTPLLQILVNNNILIFDYVLNTWSRMSIPFFTTKLATYRSYFTRINWGRGEEPDSSNYIKMIFICENVEIDKEENKTSYLKFSTNVPIFRLLLSTGDFHQLLMSGRKGFFQLLLSTFQNLAVLQGFRTLYVYALVSKREYFRKIAWFVEKFTHPVTSNGKDGLMTALHSSKMQETLDFFILSDMKFVIFLKFHLPLGRWSRYVHRFGASNNELSFELS